MERRRNIFYGVGYLTDLERKEPLEHGGNWVTFKSCIDLSEPIQVRAYGNGGKITVQQYSRDLCVFMCFWDREIANDLNGFSGFHNVKFEFTNFELVP